MNATPRPEQESSDFDLSEAEDCRQWMNEHARGHAISNSPYGHLCENQCFERWLARWLRKHDTKVMEAQR